MSSKNYTDLIEQYVSGTISEADKAMLESEFASNPSLKSEVEFQSEMVKGLQQFRKAELKARLNNIPVEVGVMQTLGQSTLVKVAASVGVAALVVGGIYYFSENAEKVTTYERLTPFAIADETDAVEKIELKELPKVEAPAAPVAGAEAEAVVRTKEEPTAAVAEDVAPDFEKPTVKEFEEEEEFEANPVGKEAIPAVTNPAEINKPVDVEVKSKGFENKLQYQFYEEKLYLYGNFGNVPYEILEINSKDGKRLYLYHQNAFYKLAYPTGKITELEKVTNESLIKELQIFRETKALN